MKKILITLIAISMFLLCALSCDDVQTDEKDKKDIIDMLSGIGLDSYIGVPYEESEKLGEWTRYDFSTDDCKCIYGSGFYVAAKSGDPDKVIVFLMGGGACWPGMDMCSTETQNFDSLAPENDSVEDIMWLSSSEENPFRDWSMLFIPYCDGSVFSGDNTIDYSVEGEVKTHYHWGLRNMSGGITVMKDLFPDAQRVLVSGSSAGGYGTFLTWAVMKYQYPDAATYIMNDSGPGVTNEDDPESFQKMKDTWLFDQFIPEECSGCDRHITYLYELYLKYDPQVRIGIFSSYEDAVIGAGFTKLYGPKYTKVIMDVTDEIKEFYPDRFNRFFIDGNCHTLSSYEPDSLGGCGLEQEWGNALDWMELLVDDNDTSWTDVLE